jgi:DNA-binding NarL/FixJ family response regulator
MSEHRGVCRVYLVDDHSMFRSGVRAELGDRIQVVGEAATVAEAITGIRHSRPDVVVLDVHLPDGGGLAVLAGVAAEVPATSFLALSVSDAAEDVIAVIRAGARGYVTKRISAAELADAITRVADGDVVFSPRLAGFVLDAFRDAPPVGSARVADAAPVAGSAAASAAPDRVPDVDLDRLTRREMEVLRLLARGYSYKEIAADLFISIKTVETHASNVLRKLQLSSRYQLTRWASDRRIV